MKIYRKIKIQEATTAETWSRLCKIESSLTFQDLLECLVPHREGLRKPIGFKSDTISQQTFDQLIEMLNDGVTRQKKVPLRPDQLSLIENVKSYPGTSLLSRTLDLILRIHNFSVSFQNFGYEMRRQILPDLQRSNSGIHVSVDNFPDLLLASKLKLILGLHYTCLLGPAINDDMIKFIKKSILIRKKISQMEPHRLTLLYVPTFLSFSFLKILRTKCLKKDLQMKLLFNLRLDIAKQLKAFKDKYLTLVNEQVSRIFSEFSNQPKIYNEGLLSCLRKVSGSEDVLIRTNDNLKSKKIDLRSSFRKNLSKKSDRISMQLKNRSMSRQETLKVFQDAIKSLKNARGQRQSRLFVAPIRKLSNAQPLSFTKYLSTQRTFTFRYFLQKIPLNVSFSIKFKQGPNDELESANCRIVIRNVYSPHEVILSKSVSTQYVDGSTNNPTLLMLKCLKKIFPLLSNSIYLPLLKNNTSSVDTMEFIHQSDFFQQLEINSFSQVDFFNHVRQLIVLGCKASLRFEGRMGYLLNNHQKKPLRSLKILDDRDEKGRRIGLRLRRISATTANHHKIQAKIQIKFEDNQAQIHTPDVDQPSRITIQLIYDDQIRYDEPIRLKSYVKYAYSNLGLKSMDLQIMKPVYFCKRGQYKLVRAVHEIGNTSVCLPEYNTRISLADNHVGKLVMEKLQMYSRLFIVVVEDNEQMLVADSKPRIYEEESLQKSQPHSVRFSTKNLAQFHHSVVLKTFEYTIISTYTHPSVGFIYEVYTPHNSQKRFTHSDNLIEQFELGICSLNGLSLLNYDNNATDIRHIYCSAQWYADYVGAYQ